MREEEDLAVAWPDVKLSVVLQTITGPPVVPCATERTEGQRTQPLTHVNHLPDRSGGDKIVDTIQAIKRLQLLDKRRVIVIAPVVFRKEDVPVLLFVVTYAQATEPLSTNNLIRVG